MKLSVLYFLVMFFIKAYHSRHVSDPENGIRIPLTRTTLKEGKWNSATAFRSNEINKIPFENQKNLAYFGSISIGTPPLEMHAIQFDTGSPFLWVYSTLCNSKFCPKNRTRYDHNSSKTYKKLDKYDNDNSEFITYGSGLVYGQWSNDTISIGGVKVDNRQFLEAEYTSGIFVQEHFDGIIGLNYKPINDSVDIISKFCQQKGINDSIFSFYFSNNLSAKNGSELILCGKDESKYTGELNYVNEVENSGHSWTIPIEKVKINYTDEHYVELSTKNHVALIDTGTSLIHGPTEHIVTILTIINLAKVPLPTARESTVINDLSTFITGNFDKLPNITFTIASKDYTLTPKDYLVQINDQNCRRIGFTDIEQDILSDNSWIFGDVFLRKYYSVFDAQNHRIGFAESVHN